MIPSSAILSVAILACVLGSPACKVPPADPHPDRAHVEVETSDVASHPEIDRTRNEYVAAWRSGDARKLAGLYTEDGLVLYPGQPAIAGRGAILDYFTTFFGAFTQNEFELTSLEIEVAGTWAFDRGSYRWKGTPRAGGNAIEDHGKYLVVLAKQADGFWRVARDMDNSDRPLAQESRGDR